MHSGVGAIGIFMGRAKSKVLPRNARERLKLARQREKYLRLRKIVLFVVAGTLVLASALGLLLWSMQDKEVTGENSPNAVAPKELPPLVYDNTIEQAAVTELRAFGDWLRTNNAAGFIGEVGWPDRQDGAQWNAVADKWYREAAHHDLWVTSWAAGSWWGEYQLAVYTHTAGEQNLDTARAQATILEKYPSEGLQQRGVNLAGMEFSTESGFHSGNLGVAGQQYFYEPAESLAYLSSRGVKLVRLPIRWERIQPELGGDLRTQEITAIKQIMDAAHTADIKVVLDLHNYGVYYAPMGGLVLGTSLGHDKLADIWLRLSKEFGSHPGLAAYGLMNEPHDLPAGSYGTPAKNWEVASQTTLDALRKANDKTLVMVAGYDWSSLERWAVNHPKGWITDSAKNFRYEAHHYWDKDGSGAYVLPFDQEL